MKSVFISTALVIVSLSTGLAGVDLGGLAATNKKAASLQPLHRAQPMGAVTGSNIPQAIPANGVSTSGSSPMRVISEAEVGRYGSGNVSDILRRYPEFTIGGRGRR